MHFRSHAYPDDIEPLPEQHYAEFRHIRRKQASSPDRERRGDKPSRSTGTLVSIAECNVS